MSEQDEHRALNSDGRTRQEGKVEHLCWRPGELDKEAAYCPGTSRLGWKTGAGEGRRDPSTLVMMMMNIY